MTDATATIDRFEKSFFLQMTRDFFLLLVLVVLAELVIRLGLIVYHFETRDKAMTEESAALLAADVKSIMLNSGGPVAARTVYPMLQKNYSDLGLKIAIQPSASTIEGIVENFEFTPSGIPADWPEGAHHEVNVDLHAEEFCVSCHSATKIGGVLGTVTVRRYLSSEIDHWWEEVRLAGVLGLSKIVLHTVLLFFLLRWRMEPLLSLRALVARLAKAGAQLTYRAEVKSEDEFGELAANLNHFLDRIGHIVDDLRDVLDKIGAVYEDLHRSQAGIGERVTELSADADRLARMANKSEFHDPMLSDAWQEAISTALLTLDALAQEHQPGGELALRSEQLSAQIREMVDRAERLSACREEIGDAAGNLAGHAQGLNDAVVEMGILEERLQGIAEIGRTLVGRLLPEVDKGDGSVEVSVSNNGFVSGATSAER